MNCLPCFNKDKDDDPSSDKTAEPTLEELTASSNAQSFNFRELAMATKNFRQECLLGEGGFGRVFKGTLQSTDQVVAVKQLDRSGTQENKEFTVEVLKLSLLNHPNLVNLIGYCADGDQRLLVYEYMPMGNLEQHLYGDDPDKKPLDWSTRMKIANGVASGLEYLHEKANPPVAYRDLKPSNVLLDNNLEPKLSDFGMFKLGAGGGGDPNGTSRVMGTYGYSAPEYSQGGEFTLKSDVYSFGVVVLELITGRRAIDTTRPSDEQNLVTWAQPIFRDPKRFPEMADPRLNKAFPEKSLNQAVGIAAMCLQEEPMVRPLISDIAPALGFICVAPNDPPSKPEAATPPPKQTMDTDIGKKKGSNSSSSSSSSSGSSGSEEEKESGRGTAQHSDNDEDDDDDDDDDDEDDSESGGEGENQLYEESDGSSDDDQ